MSGGRSAHDASLNTREFVLAQVALDLLKTQGWLLAFDEIQLVDIAGAGLVSRVMSWYWRLGGVVVGTSNRVPEGAPLSLAVVGSRRLRIVLQTSTSKAYNERHFLPS